MKIPEVGRTKTDKLNFLICCAVQSPSSHNTQPWLFAIKGDTIEVWADLTRRLPIGDPDDRELYASVGASVQNIIEGAKALSLSTQVELFPDTKNSPTLVAKIIVKFEDKKNPNVNKALLKSIWERRTNRSPYDPKKLVSSKLVAQASELASIAGVKLHVIEQRSKIFEIAEMVKFGLIHYLQNNEFRKELSGWIRHDWSRKGDGLPGYSIGMPGITSIMAPLLVQSTAPINEIANGEKKAVESCPQVAIITIPKDVPLWWVKTGMAFQSVALYLHDKGVATAILTSAIESRDQRKKIQKMVGAHPSLFFRIGYPTGMGISVPRREARLVILSKN